MLPFHNTFFKPPQSPVQRRHPSPTPPRAFVEPLSPPKPAPIEPQWSYPCLNNNVQFTYSSAATQDRLSAAGQNYERSYGGTTKSGHYRTPSIDTLAEAALAHSRHGSQPRTLNGHSHAHPPPRYGAYGASEPPHKRARSDMLPSPQVAPYASRPATSYEALPPAERDNRVEEAALLLNFRTNGWSNGSRADVHVSRPHSKSFPGNVDHPAALDRPYVNGLLPPFVPHSFGQSQSVPVSAQSRWEDSGLVTHFDVAEGASNNRPVATLAGAEAPLQLAHQGVRAATRNDLLLADTKATTESPAPSSEITASETADRMVKPKRGWPKGKPRSTGTRKAPAEKGTPRKSGGPRKKKSSKGFIATGVNLPEADKPRRKSLSDASAPGNDEGARRATRCRSLPRDFVMRTRSESPTKPSRKKDQVTQDTICAGCNASRESTRPNGEVDDWISCNGCKMWFHVDCAGFKKVHEAKDVDKFFCASCEPEHGKTTYVRKSSRAHASVDYAELQRGVLKTSEESVEHHYIQPIKDGTFQFDPEQFPRMRPELVTRDLFEKSGTFVEPICIPAAWNPRPWKRDEAVVQPMSLEEDMRLGEDADGILPSDFEYDCVADDGQDKLDMVMPQDLTVRQVANLVGPDYPLDVIDVKTQNSGSKWTLGKWADYYEDQSEDKEIRNVISLEVSQTKLGRLLRRPKVVRDIDLQDDVWPQEEIDKGKFPKVQFYCLMSIADSFTDFHIDFGGSSVYYHILRGKKTFFFIPPKAKHLKAYEDWNDSPQQNYTFLPSITKECYRVDLSEGDTMLIPSGWIHAVWTPETSLVIGGNFLNRLSYKNQFRVVEIEKNNETPQKFRYPHFQRIMWYTAIKYLEDDPLPQPVSQMFYEGEQFAREHPIWSDFDGEIAENDVRPGAKNTRYYSQAEMDGLPELVNFIFRTVMLVMGRIEGISQDKIKRVNASIPKGHGEPLEVAKTFALWVAWKRGNEDPPAWAHPDAVLPNSKDEGLPKKLSARALKEMERKEAIAAYRVAGADRQSARVRQARASTPSQAVASAFGATHLTSTPQQTNSQISISNSAPLQTPPRLIHQNSAESHQMAAPPAPVMSPAHMMIGGYHAHSISTPKTSVLGPKRVACDACRKRRIKCKHKDLVVQAQEVQRTNGHVSPPIFIDGNHFATMQNGDMVHHNQATPPHDQYHLGINGADGHIPMPGTNAYINANIPMAMNGVPIFGEIAKRGRSKACFECRKSKRRCVHDEYGNVDPVKAAETPVPRGTLSAKKRQSSDERTESPTAQKRAATSSPSQGRHTPATAPMGYVPATQPQGYHQFHSQSQPPQQSSHQDHVPTSQSMNGVFHPSYTTAEEHKFQPHLLTSASPPDHHFLETHHTADPFTPYAEQGHNGPYYSSHYTYSSSQERPPLYQLPSLEQIANEVLDMNDRHDEPPSPNGTVSVRDQQLHSGTSSENTFSHTSSIVNGVAKTEDSIDSAVSLPSKPDHESSRHDTHAEIEPMSTISNGYTHHNTGSTNADGATPQEEQSYNRSPHVAPSNMGGASFEHNANHKSSHARNSSLDGIPVYKPPAPLARSPEIIKKPMANGHANGVESSPSSVVKRKRDSFSGGIPSPHAKKAKINGEAQALADDESTQLARKLGQDDLGLRRRAEKV